MDWEPAENWRGEERERERAAAESPAGTGCKGSLSHCNAINAGLRRMLAAGSGRDYKTCSDASKELHMTQIRLI